MTYGFTNKEINIISNCNYSTIVDDNRLYLILHYQLNVNDLFKKNTFIENCNVEYLYNDIYYIKNNTISVTELQLKIDSMWVETTTNTVQRKENIDKVTQQVFKNCYAKRNITKTTVTREIMNEIDSLE